MKRKRMIMKKMKRLKTNKKRREKDKMVKKLRLKKEENQIGKQIR